MRNDYYEDPPDWIDPIPIHLMIRDRLAGICLDKTHCTIANALNGPFGREAGILSLDFRESEDDLERGVGRTFAYVVLDPAIHPWAKPGVTYKFRLDAHGRRIARNLDEFWNKPKEDRDLKKGLRELTEKFPFEAGLNMVFATIYLMPPCPSQRKDAKAGKHGTETRKTHGERGKRKKPDTIIPPRPPIVRKRTLKRTPRVGA